MAFREGTVVECSHSFSFFSFLWKFYNCATSSCQIFVAFVLVVSLLTSCFGYKSAAVSRGNGAFGLTESQKTKSETKRAFQHFQWTGCQDQENHGQSERHLTFWKVFSVQILERTRGKGKSPLYGFNRTIFTDGSETEHGCGAGWHLVNSHLKYSYRLPNYCSIFSVWGVCKKAIEMIPSFAREKYIGLLTVKLPSTFLTLGL